MAQDGSGEGLYVIRDHIVATIERGTGAGGTGEQNGSAGAGADNKVTALARCSDEPHHVIDDRFGECDGGDGTLGAAQFRGSGDRNDAEFGGLGCALAFAIAGDDAGFFLGRGVSRP